jgi:hypothetical protein
MTDIDSFPEATPNTVNRDELLSYLLDLNRRGFEVTREPNSMVYIVSLNDEWSLRITANRPISQIQLQRWGSLLYSADADSVTGVRAIVANYASLYAGLDMSIDQPPTSIRTREGEPASNISKLAALIGNAEIVVIVDPFLDNKALNTIKDIASLSDDQGISSSVRLLTSHKSKKEPTRSYFENWKSELGLAAAELRVITSGKPHRRFVVLSDGRVLGPGFSFNQHDRDEAVFSEPDSSADQAFFDEIWESSISIDERSTRSKDA